MKKLLIGLFAFSLITSTFAVELPPNWDWNTENVTLIDSFIEFQTNAKKETQIINCKIMKALVGKNATNMTYEEFKSVITKVVTENSALKDVRLKQLIIKQVAMITRCIKRFDGFKRPVINDADAATNSYVYVFLINKNKDLSAKEWRQLSMEKYLFTVKNDVRAYQTFIDRYEEEMINFDNETITADMNIVKRIIYPKLSKNEKLKPVAVKIELIVKSVQ
jgi:hypothetical protein